MAGHVAPEAVKGGPIAAIRDGDTITIDVEARRLDVELTDEEIAARVAAYEPPEPRYRERRDGEVRGHGLERRSGRRHRIADITPAQRGGSQRAGPHRQSGARSGRPSPIAPDGETAPDHRPA